MQQKSSSNYFEPEEIHLTEIWVRRDPKRWLAGALAGLFGTLVFCAVAMFFSSTSGLELWYPVKVAAIPFLGGNALQIGDSSGIWVGGSVLAVLFMFLGAVYAHMTGTNRLGPLFGVGLTWGIFGWIFINNLMMRSFREVFAADVHHGAAFFCWVAFGLSLMTTAFFDQLLKGPKN